MADATIPLEQRLEAGIDKSGGPDACWPWTKATFKHRPEPGYGRIRAFGKEWPVHRLVWTLANGPIPDDIKVLHKCDNPPCCNLRHLFLGTQMDNVKDCISKGRAIRSIKRVVLVPVALVAAIFVFVAPVSAESHPTNSGGYVTDGTPQNDDAHCVGNTYQRVSCLIARRPECPGFGKAMSRDFAMRCWAPEINAYNWNREGMFDALYCESKGDTDATNGRYGNLLQDDGVAPGTTAESAVRAFEHGYYDKWVPAGGSSPWAQTYGRYCPD